MLTSRPEGDVPDRFEAVELTPLAEGDARWIAESVLDGPVVDRRSGLGVEPAAGRDLEAGATL
ncbi:hypothetical protein BRC66_01415, partial [Halobacteriales archaeon QH_2_66_30]